LDGEGDVCAEESEDWSAAHELETGTKYSHIGEHTVGRLPKLKLVALVFCALGLASWMLKLSSVGTMSHVSSSVGLFGSQEGQSNLERHENPRNSSPAPFSPLLLCWAMVRVKGYEPEILSAQYYNHAGIFACDKYKVYSTGGVAHVGPIEAEEVAAPKATVGDFSNAGTATNSWLNTLTFMKAWDLIIKEGLWWTNDWTVKVDPDAVFFPDRLRMKLDPHTGGLNAQPLWVGNCDRVWHNSKPHLKLFGSLEVFSRNAIGTYKAYKSKCRTDLPWHGWGEDMFMQECMNMLNVEAINGTDFLGDKRCYDAPCTDIHKVAFHDFKAVKPFFQCWGQSKGSERVHRKEQERLQLLAKQQAREREEAKQLAAQRLQEMQARHELEKHGEGAHFMHNRSKADPPLVDAGLGGETSETSQDEYELFIRK